MAAEQHRRGIGRVVRSVIVDIRPLRSGRGFRWLFVGQVGEQVSRNILVVAVPYEVFVLTDSSFAVGLVGLVQVAPLIVCSIVGGTAADVMDRRRLLIGVQAVLGLTCVGLALTSGAGTAVWPIMALIAANAGASGVASPTRTAIIPSLVPPAMLPSAFALNQTLNQVAMVVGPAIAGLLIANAGLNATYWVAAAASFFTSLALLPLPSQRPAGATGRISVAATVEGWRYLRSSPLLTQTFLIDLNSMVFGMPRALFPVIGLQLLGGDATTVGLLHAAPGAGALASALTTGWVSGVRRQGRMVVYAVSVWGLAIMGVGMTRNLAIILTLLAVAGAADLISNVFRNTIVQIVVPDGLRGRLTAVKVALSGAGPRLGDAEAGAVAALATPTVSVSSGGAISLAGAVLIAWRGRHLWEYEVADPVDDHLEERQ